VNGKLIRDLRRINRQADELQKLRDEVERGEAKLKRLKDEISGGRRRSNIKTTAPAPRRPSSTGTPPA
jgi:cell division protein FtsB